MTVEKKDLDWGSLDFGYHKTDYSFEAHWKDGEWDEGGLTTDHDLHLSECAGIFHYCQEVFEGLKAYTTEDGHIVTFRPDLNGERLESSAARLEMPIFPKERFVEAVTETVRPTMLSYLLTAAVQLCTFVLICSAAILSSV